MISLLLVLTACRAEHPDGNKGEVGYDPAQTTTLLAVQVDTQPGVLDPETGTYAAAVGWTNDAVYQAPALDPRGERLAFCGRAPDDPNTSAGNAVIEGARSDGKAVFATARQYCGDVEYAPDGAALAWGEQDMEGAMWLRLNDLDGEPLAGDRKIHEQGVFNLVWALGGTAVAAITSAYTGSGPVELVDVASGDTRTLESALETWELAASPDGAFLLAADRSDLRLVDVAADTATVLHHALAEEDGCEVGAPDLARDCYVAAQEAVFSPDGTHVAYGARPVHGSQTWPELRELDLQTGETRVVATREQMDFTPAYGGDGSLYWLRDFTAVVHETVPGADPTVVFEADDIGDLRAVWPSLAR